MVASSTFFAVLAASASLASATQNGYQEKQESGHGDGHEQGYDQNDYSYGQKKDTDMKNDDFDYSDSHYSAHTSYVKSLYHSSWLPSSKVEVKSTYAPPPPVKSSASASIYYIPGTHKWEIMSKETLASAKSYGSYIPQTTAKTTLSYVAPYVVPTIISKRSTSSKFVDPFASPSKSDDGAFVPIVPYTPITSSYAKVTPAPSKGFTSVIKGNSTTKAPQTTLSLFNACSGTNATCATLRDLTYFASVVTANPTATVFAVDCAQKGKNGTQSCFDKAMTVTQGPSIFQRVDDSTSSVPKTVSCNIISRTASASCTETARVTALASSGTSPRNANVTGKSFGFQAAQIYYNSLIVTAGAEKLSASRVPIGPSTTAAAAAASASASGNAAGALTAPAASIAGIGAIVFAVLAL